MGQLDEWIAPVQIIRKWTAWISAISCLAPGETSASWPRSFSSYRLPAVVSGWPAKAVKRAAAQNLLVMTEARAPARRESLSVSV